MDTICFTLAFIDGLGAPEMMLIFVIVLVLFGGQKLPEFARGLGKSIREFKKAAAGVEEEFKRALEEDERKATQAKLAAAAAATPPSDQLALHQAPEITEEFVDHAAGVSTPATNDTAPIAESVVTPAPATDTAPVTEETIKPLVPHAATVEPTILPPNPKPATPPTPPPASGGQPDFP
jgi:sec-independent protein translocase protein TatA